MSHRSVRLRRVFKYCRQGVLQWAGPHPFCFTHVFAGATLPEDGQSYDAALAEWLADPPNVKPGSFMPNLALTSQEIESLIVWLEGNK